MSFPIAITETFPENWPPDLAKLAAPTVSIPLSPEDATALGGFSTVFRRQMEIPARNFLSDELQADIENALLKTPEGVMPRIGYCSWKASLIEKRPARTLRDVLQILTTDDPRVGNALSVQVGSGDPVVLHLRAWRDIPDWSEMRMFFKGGRYLGASQYAYRRRFSEVVQYAQQIEDTLQLAATRLLQLLHVDDVVADIALRPKDGKDPGSGVSPLLIELNPYGALSDACLFTWDKGGDFDGRFRYTRHHGATA